MKVAKITEVKNNLSKFLEHVKRGEVVIIYERAYPIAEIIPISRENRFSRYIDELERDGIVKKGNGKKIKELSTFSASKKKSGVLSALLDERRNGR